MEDNKTNASPQETPRSAAPDSRAAAHPSDTIKQERAAVTPDADEQPTPPRLPRVPPKADGPPPEAPPAPRRSITRKLSEPPPEGTLADLVWMPPTEDRVAQFLNEVTDIPPPPTRTREGAPAASFVLPGATSPEEAERKKARAEPFWSQMAATPMEPQAPTPPRSRRSGRKRGRLRLWLALSAACLILVIAALAFVVYTHPGLLHLK